MNTESLETKKEKSGKMHNGGSLTFLITVVVQQTTGRLRNLGTIQEFDYDLQISR
jgi:hypothetical protein